MERVAEAAKERWCHDHRIKLKVLLSKSTWLLAWCSGAQALWVRAATGSAGCRQLSTGPRLIRRGAAEAPPGRRHTAKMALCVCSASR